MMAIEIFETHCGTSRMTWLMYGDINQRRIDYVKARIGALSLGQNPSPSLAACLHASLLIRPRPLLSMATTCV